MTDDPELERWLRESLDVAVRSGFGTEDELVEDFLEQLKDELNLWDGPYEPLETWRTIALQALADQRARQATWEGPTTNDRLDAAFDELLDQHGVIALQDAGYTMSDGWSDVAEVAAEHPEAWGGCFYHRQDLERAVRDEGLMLAFGSFAEGDDHEPESLRLAGLVCEVLERHGVSTTWDGTLQRRIHLAPFPWRRRRP